jgi:hypothetical protein
MDRCAVRRTFSCTACTGILLPPGQGEGRKRHRSPRVPQFLIHQARHPRCLRVPHQEIIPTPHGRSEKRRRCSQSYSAPAAIDLPSLSRSRTYLVPSLQPLNKFPLSGSGASVSTERYQWRRPRPWLGCPRESVSFTKSSRGDDIFPRSRDHIPSEIAERRSSRDGTSRTSLPLRRSAGRESRFHHVSTYSRFKNRGLESGEG